MSPKRGHFKGAEEWEQGDNEFGEEMAKEQQRQLTESIMYRSKNIVNVISRNNADVNR